MRLWRSAMVCCAVLIGSAPAGIGAGEHKGALVRHFYYVDDTAAWESLSKNIGAVGMLSPSWIYIQDNGELKLAIDGRVKQLAAQNNVSVTPVVTNENFRIEAARAAFDEARQESVIAALMRAVVAEDFSGLHLDLENLEASDREGYVRFVERLGAAIHKQKKTLSVAVVSPVYSPVPSGVKPDAWQPTPHSAGFDYDRLAKAADFITLMTYDQYTSPDSPGPVAGMSWMEVCIRKVLESVPAGKISLGIPLYHRHWAGKQVTTGTWIEAQELSWKAKVGSTFDPVHEEPVIRFTDGQIDHTIWYQNAFSIKRRMELAERYHLRGFSAWRIGQEDPSVWTEVVGPVQGAKQ